MKHTQLDLETLGVEPGRIILSIGACVFDPLRAHADPVDEKFYCNISRASCEDYGLTADPNTEAWWETQSDENKMALMSDQQPLDRALMLLFDWWKAVGATHVWCNGANFDVVLVEAAIRAVTAPKMEPGEKFIYPWEYYAVRCTRTILALAGLKAKDFMVGAAHNALNAAMAQSRAVAAAFKKLNLKTVG